MSAGARRAVIVDCMNSPKLKKTKVASTGNHNTIMRSR